MGIVFRQSVKSIIVIFFGALLGAITNLIYPYVFSKTELGLFTNIIYQGAMLQIFMMLGTGTLVAIYTQKYHEHDIERKVLFTFSMVTTLITTLIFTVIYILFKEDIISHYQAIDRPLVREYFYWIPVLILLMSFMSVFDNYLLAHTKTAITAFSKEVLLRIVNLGLLALVFYHIIDFKTFIGASVLAYVIPVLILFFISSRIKDFGFSINRKVFPGSKYRELVSFAWYHLLLGVSLNVLGYIDTLMLGALDKNGMQTVAPYRIAVFIVAIMVIPYRAMSASSHSTLNRAYIDNDVPKLSDLFARAGVNILIVATGMFLFIACNLDNAVAILPKGYETLKPIVLILMLGKLIDMATGLNSEVIGLSKYYKFNFRISILLLVLVVVFNRLLIPVYGIYGAAWGTTIALIIFNIGKLIFLWSKMHIHPFSKGSLQVILAGVIAGSAGYFLPHIYLLGAGHHHFINPAIDAFIRTTVIIIIYGLLLIRLKPSTDINTYIKSVISNRRLY